MSTFLCAIYFPSTLKRFKPLECFAILHILGTVYYWPFRFSCQPLFDLQLAHLAQLLYCDEVRVHCRLPGNFITYSRRSGTNKVYPGRFALILRDHKRSWRPPPGRSSRIFVISRNSACRRARACNQKGKSKPSGVGGAFESVCALGERVCTGIVYFYRLLVEPRRKLNLHLFRLFTPSLK